MRLSALHRSSTKYMRSYAGDGRSISMPAERTTQGEGVCRYRARAPLAFSCGGTPAARSSYWGGGLPLRYVRDLRPLTAIPLDAISASLRTPPHSRTMIAPWGTPDKIRPGSTAWPPRCAPRFFYCGGTPAARSSYWGALRTFRRGHTCPQWGTHLPCIPGSHQVCPL